jgi:hypothetical protein
MVILTSPAGQISNRFFQHINFDSFCRENEIEFYNSFLSGVYKDYPNLKPKKERKLLGLLMRTLYRFRLNKLIEFHFKDETQNDTYRSALLKSKILFCAGWYFRSEETTLKYRGLYQYLFDPNINKSALKEKWLKRSNNTEKIIGVHIRRGDYKKFAGGKYYYHDSVYINMMRQLKLALDSESRYIIFSNDPNLDAEEYNKVFKNVSVSANSVVVDHFLMSQCDYIIGPPSTFSLWASYIGETFYYHIKDENDNITMDKFKICIGLE